MAFWGKLLSARKAASAKALPGALILAGTLPNTGGSGLAPKPFPIAAPNAIHAPRPADWFVLADRADCCWGSPRMRVVLPTTYRALYGITAHLSPETE